jgi:replication initiator protein
MPQRQSWKTLAGSGAMGEVHQLLIEQGRQGALQEGHDRLTVEAAAAYLADEDSAIGFLYSGFCQTGLPHKRLPDATPWQIETAHTTLIVEPGLRPVRGGLPQPVGVPYGSRARLILIYLQSEAMRTRRREIELGHSLRIWMGRMGIPIGGSSLTSVRDQAERISRCRFTFHIQTARAVGLVNQNVVDTALFLDTTDAAQGQLFISTARLSEGFYNQLQKHAVPLEEAAVRAVANNSMALDIYAWLSFRLHTLKSPTPIHWKAAMGQFGLGFSRLNNFRATFLDNLKLALAVYPDAKVDVDATGLVLHPSRPPVSPRQIAGKGSLQ